MILANSYNSAEKVEFSCLLLHEYHLGPRAAEAQQRQYMPQAKKSTEKRWFACFNEANFQLDSERYAELYLSALKELVKHL